MNEREADKYVRKDNIWKKPDYQAMIDEGISVSVVYYIKKVRDSLNASPRYPYSDNTPEKRIARQKEYIETVRQLEDVMKDVRSVEDAMKAYDRVYDRKRLSQQNFKFGRPTVHGRKERPGESVGHG